MDRLSEHPTLEEARDFFRDDTYAYVQTGCRIVECEQGHAVAELQIDPKKHFNAQQHVMGGVIFTLADYAFAAASVPGTSGAVSLTSSIEFMKIPKGKKLIAICDVDSQGNKVGFYTTDVFDDEDIHVAKIATTCYRPAAH